MTYQWPALISDRLWIHLIDNAAAEASLIRGSSSVASGDTIVSQTWKRVVQFNALLRIHRVASKSNPVDGLSRGLVTGDWKFVEQATIPRELFRRIKYELHLQNNVPA